MTFFTLIGHPAGWPIFACYFFLLNFFFFSETFFNSLKTWKKLLLKKFNYQFGSRKYTLNILLLVCLKSLRGWIENCKYRTTYLRIAHSSKSYYFEFWFRVCRALFFRITQHFYRHLLVMSPNFNRDKYF